MVLRRFWTRLRDFYGLDYTIEPRNNNFYDVGEDPVSTIDNDKLR